MNSIGTQYQAHTLEISFCKIVLPHLKLLSDLKGFHATDLHFECTMIELCYIAWLEDAQICTDRIFGGDAG